MEKWRSSPCRKYHKDVLILHLFCAILGRNCVIARLLGVQFVHFYLYFCFSFSWSRRGKSREFPRKYRRDVFILQLFVLFGWTRVIARVFGVQFVHFYYFCWRRSRRRKSGGVSQRCFNFAAFLCYSGPKLRHSMAFWGSICAFLLILLLFLLLK